MDKFKLDALFYMINARTTYKMLLGRLWTYENGIVLSTLYQCFKYCQNRQVKKVEANFKPFTMAESYFADAKFYDNSTTCEEKICDLRISGEIAKSAKGVTMQEKITRSEVSTSKTSQPVIVSYEALKSEVGVKFKYK